MKQLMGVTIELVKVATPEVMELLEELNRALAGPYSKEQTHALPADHLFRPNIRFFVARLDGEAVACGGIAFFDGYAELKRMYSQPRVRGRGVAKALLGRLEAEAREARAALLRIETGIHQHEAIRFYEDASFHRRGPFGPYAQMPPTAIELSLFCEKAM